MENKTDNNNINDMELVMLYNKHLKYLHTLKLGEKTLFGNTVNTKMIEVMKKRRDVIKDRYIGPKYKRLVSHINRRMDGSTSRRISY